MKLSPFEEKRLLKEGLVVTGLFTVILLAVFQIGNSMVDGNLQQIETIRKNTQQTATVNQNATNDIKFLRDNKQSIETMFTILKNLGSGIKMDYLTPFSSIGITDNVPIAPSKTPGNTTEYSGIRLSGNKSEFQRIVEALNTVENNQGLLQVKNISLKLPSQIKPNGVRPTYIDLQVELVAPISK